MITCFDIGGTAIKGGYAESPERISVLPRVPTPVSDFDGFVAVLRQAIAQAPRPSRGVALSLAGVIAPETGEAIIANVPCLHGRRLVDELTAALGLPVVIGNDADCFALAEAGLGAGQGHRVVFGVILGTGVGGGLVVDGRLINQDGGFAGEWGHAPVAATHVSGGAVVLPRFACGCGLAGCIDATCSARGMERLHQHLHGQHLSSEAIIAEWRRGAAAACQTMDIYLELLAAPLALVVNVTGATVLPLGGGLSNVPELITALDARLRGLILRRTSKPLIVKARCAVEPGLIGAALLGFAALS